MGDIATNEKRTPLLDQKRTWHQFVICAIQFGVYLQHNIGQCAWVGSSLLNSFRFDALRQNIENKLRHILYSAVNLASVRYDAEEYFDFILVA